MWAGLNEVQGSFFVTVQPWFHPKEGLIVEMMENLEKYNRPGLIIGSSIDRDWCNLFFVFYKSL